MQVVGSQAPRQTSLLLSSCLALFLGTPPALARNLSEGVCVGHESVLCILGPLRIKCLSVADNGTWPVESTVTGTGG